MKTAIVIGLLSIAMLFSPKAKADYVDDYIYTYGPAVVCGRFDTAGTVTKPVIRAMGQYLMAQGFSSSDSARIIWDSVNLWCPRYSLAVKAVAML